MRLALFENIHPWKEERKFIGFHIIFLIVLLVSAENEPRSLARRKNDRRDN
jgi:hypothetical protein